MLQGDDKAPYKQAEAFLDKAGIIGSLRRPFLAPFDVAYRRGVHDIERAVARHWQHETLSPISQILSRFPFNQGAEREVAPSELDLLNESSGSFWQDVHVLCAGPQRAVGSVSRAQRRRARCVAAEGHAEHAQSARSCRAPCSTARASDSRCASVFRSVPGGITTPDNSAPPSAAFLQIGKVSVYGFNQRVTAEPLSIEWWNQGIALVGSERTAARSGRKHTETLEVADSAWSLFRLLQRPPSIREGVSTWRILSDAGQGETVIRFVLSPDPWPPFGFASRSEWA